MSPKQNESVDCNLVYNEATRSIYLALERKGN